MKPHHCRLLVCLSGLWAMTANGQQLFQMTEDMPPKWCAFEQVLYHSNLFRLDETVTDVESRLGPGATADDTVFRTSACANLDWEAGQQAFALNLLIDDNRYVNNDLLNHTSGAGRALWEWRTAGDWYGELGGSYKHALSSFVNDRPLAKDLVDAYQYFAELNHDFGTYIKVNALGTQTNTSHTTEARQVDNYRSTSGEAGLTVTSLSENYIGVTVKSTRAEYPYDVIVNAVPLDRDYREDSASIRFRYELAAHTVLRGSYGRMRREYSASDDDNVEGNIWRAGVNWKPSAQLEFDLVGWQELSAYFDTAANQFVSRGGSLTTSWLPRDRLKVSALIYAARQKYLTDTPILPDTVQRKDEVLIAGIDTQYRPIEILDFNLSYNHEQHDSNLTGYGYTDNVAALRVRLRF